jgi:transposase-like protein
VPERARRRSFTAACKLEVLAAYDAAGPGEKGAILRREGLYSSHIVDWRRSRDSGALAGPARPRGRPAADPRDAQIARLQKEKAQLEQELARARFVVDLGVTQSHSRPHVSNDNPYSEAQFKTLTYRPGFPARFPSIEAARAHCQNSSPGT